jgi:hypothetical protein
VVVDESGGGRARESRMARRKSNGRKELLACCKRNRFQSLARQEPRQLESRASIPGHLYLTLREWSTALSSVSRSSSSQAQVLGNQFIALLLGQLEVSPTIYSDILAISLCY